MRTKEILVIAIVALIGATIVASIGVGVREFTHGSAKVVESSGNAISNVIDHVGDALSKITRPEITNQFNLFVNKTQKEQQLHVATWGGVVNYVKEEKYWPSAYAKVEVRAPVTVPIYVDLHKGAWDFIPSESKLYVFPPRLIMGDPAVVNSQIERRVLYSCWRINTKRMLQEAEKSLWSELKDKAHEGSEEARSDARDGIQDFIKSWFLKTSKSADKTEIIIVFPDEVSTIPSDIEQQHASALQ